jgi:hypothetical protein
MVASTIHLPCRETWWAVEYSIDKQKLRISRGQFTEILKARAGRNKRNRISKGGRLSVRNFVHARRTTGKKKPRQGRARRGERLLEAEVLGCNTIAV